MALREATMTIQGKQVHYWIDDSHTERTLLFLHGVLGDAAVNWRDILTEFGQTDRVIAPDLPGFGGSDLLPRTNLLALIDWLNAFLRALAVDEVIVVGSSFGGLLARLFAATHANTTRALVLVNGGTLPQAGGLLRLVANLPLVGHLLTGTLARSFRSRENLEAIVHVKSILTDEMVAALTAPASGSRAVFRVLVGDTPPLTTTPQTPTLLLWGQDDALSPPSVAEGIKANIPRAQLRPIAECGHLPQLEVPDVFTFQLRAFVNGLTQAQSKRLPGVGPLSSPH